MLKKKLMTGSILLALILMVVSPVMAAPLQLDGAGASFPIRFTRNGSISTST